VFAPVVIEPPASTQPSGTSISVAWRGASELTTTATLSMGVATMRGIELTEPIRLFFAADSSLYRAKRAGRNRVAVF